MIDLTKLSPTPWFVGCCERHGGKAGGVEYRCYGLRSPQGKPVTVPDLEFIALARNAFGIMVRRRWWSMACPNGWAAVEQSRAEQFGVMWAGCYAFPGEMKVCVSDDPFTCLAEADAIVSALEVRTPGAPPEARNDE